MKRSGLIIYFLVFATTLSAQHIHSLCKTKDIEVIKSFVDGIVYAQSVQHPAKGLQPVEFPVTFKSFQADRLRTKVDLVWETTSEIDNAGFEIQRRSDSGEWQKVAFVFSQAADGNSKTLLTYEYTDVNIIKDGSEYRLKQVDINKQTSYSETRSIGGYLTVSDL